MTAQASEWDGILDPDETIVWQGSPTGRVRSEFKSAFHFVFMLVWGGIPTVMVISNPASLFLIVPAVFMAITVWFFVGQHFWAAYRRRNTFYTLTDRRVFIGTNVFGKRTLDSIPITPDLNIELDDKPEGNIWLDDGGKTGKFVNGQRQRRGFEQLADPREIYAKLRTVQKALS